MPGPVGDGAALDVARADHDVEALAERRHQRRQRGGVVREVGVDLDAGVVAALEAPGEAGPVRAAEPGLGGPLEQVHVGQLGRDLLHDLGGAVGAAVVDHQHTGAGQALVDPAQHPLDVLRLVVGRNDHQRSHAGILGEVAVPASCRAGAAAGPGSAPGLAFRPWPSVPRARLRRRQPGNRSDVDRLHAPAARPPRRPGRPRRRAPGATPAQSLGWHRPRGSRSGPRRRCPGRRRRCPPSVAPTSTAISTQKGFSCTVLLMMTGFRTWFSTCWYTRKTISMVIPAGTEWMAAMTTTGTPASRPPTSGSRSTRATKTPSSRAKGTPRISRVTPDDDPGDDRGGAVAQHVAGDRADGLVDDPVQAVRRRGLEEAQEARPTCGGPPAW